ncbi:hypothetical protein [Actinocrispum sp. NPDC049592]|uniref:hypothetical protein n=1 Tax=Actinocrispum sp. NPDC049592 TaxID=3154835 RepID=UPI00343DA53E
MSMTGGWHDIVPAGGPVELNDKVGGRARSLTVSFSVAHAPSTGAHPDWIPVPR